MRRSGPVLLLALAVAITAGLAILFAEGVGGGGRRDRETVDPREPEAARREPVRRPEGPGERTPSADRTWKVFGQVTDAGGRPVGGATVRATVFPERRRIEAATDRTGLYELDLVRPYCVFDVFADGYLPLVGVVDGFPSGERDFWCEGEGPWRSDFVLEAAATLAGRVLDESLAPVAGARVYVISKEHAVLDRQHIGNVTLTGGTGRFSFPGVPPGEVDVGVRAGCFLPKLERDVTIPGSGAVDLTLVLEMGRSIRVEVDGATEDTIVRATDSRLRGRGFPGGIESLTDALVGREFAGNPVVSAIRWPDGRYLLQGVGPGPADVEAVDEERITETGLGRLLSTTEPSLHLVLLPFAAVRIRVFDAVTGAPLDPRVSRTSGGSDERHPVPRVEGEWLVPVDGRPHALHFELEGYEPARLDLPPRREDRRGEPFEVPLRPRTDFEGGTFRLLCEPPLAGRMAVVGRNREGRIVWTKHIDRPDERGRWVVESVPVGEYAVTVLATGMIPVTLPRVVVTSTLEETHRVPLSEGGGLEMKVTDTRGELLEEVGIALADAAGTPIDIHVITHVSEGRAFLSVNYLPNAATARADSGLAPGAYSLTAYKAGYEVVTEEFVISGTEVAEVAIVLPRR